MLRLCDSPIFHLLADLPDTPAAAPKVITTKWIGTTEHWDMPADGRCYRNCTAHPYTGIGVLRPTRTLATYMCGTSPFGVGVPASCYDCPNLPLSTFLCSKCLKPAEPGTMLFTHGDDTGTTGWLHAACAKFCTCCYVAAPDTRSTTLEITRDWCMLMVACAAGTTPEMAARLVVCYSCWRGATTCARCSSMWLRAETAANCPTCARRALRSANRSAVVTQINQWATIGASVGGTVGMPMNPWKEWLGREIVRLAAPGHDHLMPDTDDEGTTGTYVTCIDRRLFDMLTGARPPQWITRHMPAMICACPQQVSAQTFTCAHALDDSPTYCQYARCAAPDKHVFTCAACNGRIVDPKLMFCDSTDEPSYFYHAECAVFCVYCGFVMNADDYVPDDDKSRARIHAGLPRYPNVLAHRLSLCSGCSAERDNDETD